MGIGGGSWMRLGQEQVISSDVAGEVIVSEEAVATTIGNSGEMIPREISASLQRKAFSILSET